MGRMQDMPEKMQLDERTFVRYNGCPYIGAREMERTYPCKLISKQPNGSVDVKNVATICMTTRDDELIQAFRDEAKLWAEVPDHPNVLKLLGSKEIHGRSSGDGSFKQCLVAERMQQSLHKLIFHDEEFANSCTYGKVLDLIEQICTGLQHLHHQQIVHYEFIPDNILISGAGEVKIASFGLSEVVDAGSQSVLGTCKGTMVFMAPEVTATWGPVVENTTARVSQAIDIYSLGVVMWMILNRKEVGDHPEQNAGLGRLISWPDMLTTHKIWCGGPEELCKLIEDCLKFQGVTNEASDHGRPSIDQVLTRVKKMKTQQWVNRGLPAYCKH